MVKGKNKHKKGSRNGGGNSSPPSNRGRRGGGPGGRGRGRGRGGGGHRPPGSSFLQDELDFTIKMYADSPNPPPALSNGHSTCYGRGQGRGLGFGRTFTPEPQQKNGNIPGKGRGFNHSRGYDMPHGRGRGRGDFNPYSPEHGRGRGYFDGYSPRHGRERGDFNGYSPGHGRGRGDFDGYSPRHGRGLGASAESTPSKLGPNATLSDLLSASRPLLRPIKFVRSVNTPFLFQQEEQILQPVAEDIGDDEASHVPTADQIERIFHGSANPFGRSSSSSSSEDEEEIEEVDFNDMGKLFSPKQGRATAKCKVKVNTILQMPQGQVNPGLYQETRTSVSSQAAQHFGSHTETATVSAVSEEALEVTSPKASNTPLFVVDTKPGTVPVALQAPRPETPPEDEDIIVYVAPHPKPRKAPVTTTAPATSTTVNAAKDDNFTGLSPENADTSAFQPYSPPAALSLASMSIQDKHPSPVPSPEPAVVQEPTPETRPPDSPPLTAPTESHPLPSTKSVKFEFASALNKEFGRTATPGRMLPSIMTPRMAKKQAAWERKKAKRERAAQKRKGRKSGHFAAFGAWLSEARLRGKDVAVEVLVGGKDPKWEERRRGDSDLDWGTESEGEARDKREEEERKFVGYTPPVVKSDKAKGKEKAKEVDVEGDHGMQVDEDMDIAAMKMFVGGLIGGDAGVFKTMDDVEDEERIKVEDEEGLGGAEGSSDESDGEAEFGEDSDDEEVEDVLKLEEKMLIGEGEDDSDNDLDAEEEEEEEEEGEEDGESEDGNELSPNSSFQARLERLRARSREKKLANASVDDDEDSDMLEQNLAWAEEDDDHIQELLARYAETHGGSNRKVQDRDFADMQPARKGKDKSKGIPEDLQELWERDRQKKAEKRRKREEQKLIDAADPFTKKKGGKKGRKAMLAASRLDSTTTINVVPNRIIDITTLVTQIRRFVADLDGPELMVLPPASKETRKNVHEIAMAFGLKSVSKGHGDARYTTLIKTTRTGGRADEWRVAKVVRRAGGAGARGDRFGEVGDGGRGRGGVKVPKQREGEEVGAAAPKIGENNVGFKMLAAMGWTEGDKIGLSGGLDAPLVAIIKHSKLGLGARR